jgi:hypothetical protein
MAERVALTAKALELREEFFKRMMAEQGVTEAELREMANDETAVLLLNVLCQNAADRIDGTTVIRDIMGW